MDAAPSTPDAPQSKLRWYQYSLRTLLVSVGVFCFMMGMNTRPQSGRMLTTHVSITDEGYCPGISVLCHDYGWPWPCKTKDVVWGEIVDDIDWAGFVGNVAVGLVLLVGVNVAVEGALRLFSRRRQNSIAKPAAR
jgi:hypothetical protein